MNPDPKAEESMMKIMRTLDLEPSTLKKILPIMNFQDGVDIQSQYLSTRKTKLDAKIRERDHRDLWAGMSYAARLK